MWQKTGVCGNSSSVYLLSVSSLASKAENALKPDTFYSLTFKENMIFNLYLNHDETRISLLTDEANLPVGHPKFGRPLQLRVNVIFERKLEKSFESFDS